MIELSQAEARMLALSGLGLRGGLEKPGTAKTTPLDVIDRLGLLQIDSVNVFERAHYMPIFSRIGSYDKDALAAFDQPADGQTPRLIEYWAHEASLIKLADLPLYKWRMDGARASDKAWAQFGKENQPLLDWIKAEIASKGPLTVNQIEHDRNVRKGTWWGWSDVKTALEWLFMIGELTSAGRQGFARRYALPEQVWPQQIQDALANAVAHDSKKELLTRAADVLTVATAKDLADYPRLGFSTVGALVRELVEEGVLTPAKVTGWADTAYLSKRAVTELEIAPAGTNPTTFLSPFDPTVWFRDRAVRLFDFEYKIEIYTPKEKRTYGYYTLPVLHNRKVIGRIDLKSDRQNKALLVQAAWAENWLTEAQIESGAKALAKTLREAQKWQGLNQIVVEPVGTMAKQLAKALA